MAKSPNIPVLKDINGKILKKNQVVKMLKPNPRYKMGIIDATGTTLWISVPNEKYGCMDFTWKNWNTEVEIIGDIQENPELISQVSNQLQK